MNGLSALDSHARLGVGIVHGASVSGMPRSFAFVCLFVYRLMSTLCSVFLRMYECVLVAVRVRSAVRMQGRASLFARARVRVCACANPSAVCVLICAFIFAQRVRDKKERNGERGHACESCLPLSLGMLVGVCKRC